MNFLSNLANSIPVVGHVKGVIHFAAGDSEGGKQAMYQATRTTAVLGAGAAGSLAGPAGAAMAAMYAGVLTDGAASVVMDEPQGVMKGCENIAEDLKKGKNPINSVAGVAFQVGMDGVGGLGMGGVSSAASQVSEKAVTKGVENIAKNAVKTVGEKTIQKTMKMTGEQVVKTAAKTFTKKTIETAAVQAEIALVSTHVCIQADERTKKEEKEQHERKERERRDREERERREREERERREREERERREREERERREREEREQLEREEQGRRQREEREYRAREEREQQERQARVERDRRVREQTKRHGTSGTSSGSPQQPQGNKDNNKKSGDNASEIFEAFKKLLEELLQRIFGNTKTAARTNISRIFSRLSQGQIDYLETKILNLQASEILEEVLTLVIKIFADHFPNDISFPNFLSLLEFVAVYLKEEIAYRYEVFRMDETISRRNDPSIPKKKPKDVKKEILSIIMDLAGLVHTVFDVFETVQSGIEAELAAFGLSPNFRNIFSAVYHYFKHRIIPGSKKVLAITEYYEWIRRVLAELRKQQEYNDLLEEQRPRGVRRVVTFQIYIVAFGRRIKMIVKFDEGKIELSSCYFLDKPIKNDQDGDVWFEIRRL